MSLGLSQSLALGRGVGDSYAVANLSPELVLDFENARFLNTSTDGADLGAVVGSTNHERGGTATQLDASGNLVWCPHNLALNSASPATQNITVVVGAQYTVEMTGTGSITLSGAGSGTVSDGNPVEVTATTTTLTCTVAGSPTTMWAYRSDLGGMAPVPVSERSGGSSTYLPTTGAQRFLKRQAHYVNGTRYCLLEPTAATNLITDSQDFTGWASAAATVAKDATGPDGVTNSACTFGDDSSTGTGTPRILQNVTVSTSTAYTWSVFAKADQLSWIALRTSSFTTPGNVNTFFDLSNGVIGSVGAGHTATIEDYGSGWYRCAITFTTDSVDTTGDAYIYVAEADGDFVVDLDGTSSILVYGAQFEEGAVPSSLVPTIGGTATRAADTNGLPIAAASLPVSGASSVSFALDALVTYADEGSTTQARYIYWQADANNFIHTDLDTAAALTGTPTTDQTTATVSDTATAADAYSGGIDERHRVASRHTSGAVQIAADGTAGTENSTPTAIADLSAADLEISRAGGGLHTMMVRSFRMWATDIGEAGLEEASV